MRITNKNGTVIDSFESWKEAFVEVDNEKHWSEGRSACSLAKHFTGPNVENSNGIRVLKKCLSSFGLHNVELTHGEIEHESRFDKYRGKGRMQDLILWGHADKPIVICVEAKVDETFGNKIDEAYKEAVDLIEKKKKLKSKAKQRIEDLCKEFYADSPTASSCNALRYQLLYYLAGSLKEAIKIKGMLFIPVIVYHTDDFNKEIGDGNYNDYAKFMESVGFSRYDKDEAVLYKNVIGEIEVFSAYIEIKQ